MTKFMSLVVILFVTFLISSCGGNKISDADRQQSEQTAKMMDEANRQTGMPNLTNFQQKKILKEIYELCDKENLICYAYIQSDYTGKLVFLGKCIGYGIPFSAQYSNPTTYKRIHSGGDLKAMPQPEPNGLFMPTSSSATWLIMIDPETQESRPMYLEPNIVVSPFKLPVSVLTE